MTKQPIIYVKAKNRRLSIVKIFDESEVFYVLEGKRLKDRKTRDIIKWKHVFTEETFVLIYLCVRQVTKTKHFDEEKADKVVDEIFKIYQTK